MKTDAFVIADWFIAHNNAVMRFNSADEISNLKIQKLLYYAQGCALVSMGKELFHDDIVAWNYGPVVEAVYNRFMKYERGGIAEVPNYPEVDLDTEKLLINTYNTFAKYSAWELANRTHKESPWKKTPMLSTIPIELIREYFEIHYQNVNIENDLTENIEELNEFSEYKSNWDGEEGVPFDRDFIREVIDLISTLTKQPDVGATGRGSIDLEYGSMKPRRKYLDLEIYENDRSVHVYQKSANGNTMEDIISMEDVNGRVRQF